LSFAAIAVVSTVTVGSTEVAQSSKIFFDISIASFTPIGQVKVAAQEFNGSGSAALVRT
jgi:hypothetical protein